MKKYIYFFVFFVLKISFPQPAIDPSYTEATLIEQLPTYATIAEPKHVLVVYNAYNNMSKDIKDYYVQSRDIPTDNVFRIYLSDTTLDNHVIKLVQNGEIIKDTTQAWADREPFYAGPSIHAWQYFNDRIFLPIQNYLRTKIVDGDTLKNIIRYIVLCKGVPIRIQARWDWSGIGLFNKWNVAVDPLLCFLNQPDPNFSILNLYGTNYSSLPNPYRYVDNNFSFDYRFNSNYFTIQNTSIKLSYLVSRLDGLTQGKVIQLIEKSCSPDRSGEKTWVIDTRQFFLYNSTQYPAFNLYQQNYMLAANTKLQQLGFNTNCDGLDTNFIVNNNGEIMGYTSWGAHSYLPSGYILDTLDFELANGAVFNTLESFNGNSMGLTYGDRNIRRNGQGLLSEYIYADGTGGVCHTWEPYLYQAIQINYFYPAYAMGYGLVDAAYIGMPNLGWQNVVIGDPLTTIAWGKQNLPDSTTFTGANLITGEINLLGNAYLTSGTALKFKHNGYIGGEGYLIPEDRDYVLETIDWNKSLFKSSYNNHPMLIWGAYTGQEAVAQYKIYRKWESAGYELIGYVNHDEFAFVDNDVEIINPDSEIPKNAQYYIIAHFNTEDNSDPSNEIEYYVGKFGKKGIAPEKIYTYELSQNYPNPFNPETTIRYCIPEKSRVVIKVFDVLGKEIKTVVDNELAEGTHQVKFNAGGLPSGVYFYRITAGKYSETKKMLVTK